MKRFLALLLALVLLVGSVPVTYATEAEEIPEETPVTEPIEETQTPTEETAPVTETEPVPETTEPEAEAQTVNLASGSIGDLCWSVTAEGVLTVSGSGEMPDYPSHEETPWAAWIDQIVVLELAEGITHIGSYAFSLLPIDAVVIPDSVTTMGEGAFYHCTDLTRVELGRGLQAIPRRCFRWCGLTCVTVPENITRLEESALDYCFSLTEVQLHDGITYIGPKAFWNDPITSVDLPEGLTVISYGAFSDTALTAVTIPENVDTVEGCAFSNTPLASVTLPASLKTIGDLAFSNTRLTEITLPAGLESMGDALFQYYEDAGLQTVKFLGSAPTLTVRDDEAGAYGTFACVTATIRYPAGDPSWDAVMGKDYGGDLTWEAWAEPEDPEIPETDFTFDTADGQITVTGYQGKDTQITVPATIQGLPVTAIGDYAFSDEFELTKVTLPEGITSIGEQAFAWCYALEEVNLPQSLTSIGYGAFQSCGQLKQAHISVGITRIEGDTFFNCYSLQTLTLPEGLTYIGDYAFGYCKALTALQLPDWVSYIGDYAFRGCSGVKVLTLPKCLTAINEGAFSCMDALPRVVIPEGVSAIGVEAFNRCYGLAGVTIPATVGAVGTEAFDQCGNLRCVSYGGSQEQKDAMVIASGNKKLNDANWHLSGSYCKVTLTSVKAHATGKPELTWPDLGCMASYEIYRSTSSKGTYTLLDTTSGYTYVDESAVLGKKYYYKLVGINNEGQPSEKTAAKSGYCRLAQPVITAQSPDRVPVLTWEKVENATKYEIWRGETYHDTFEKIATTSRLTFTDTKAPLGKVSWYKVRALGSDSNVTGIYSQLAFTGYAVNPPVLKLSLNDAGLPALSWNKISGANFYDIYRGDTPEGPFQRIGSQKGLAFQDKSAPAQRECFYYVVAVAPGDGCSGTSQVLSVTTACPTPTLTAVTPDSTTGLPVLSWVGAEGAALYEISRAAKSSGSYTLIGTAGGSSYTDTTALVGKTYYYKVTAVTEQGTRSKASGYKSGKRVCAAPDLSGCAAEIATGKPFMSWEAVSGAKKYEVYRAASENGKYSKIATVSNATSGSWFTYTDTKASAGKTWYYKVKAITDSGSGNSAYSKIVSGLCYCAQPKVKLTVHAATGQPELSWSKVTGAVKYEIERAFSAEGPYTSVQTQTGTTFRDTDAVTDTTCFYRVTAVAANADYNSLVMPELSVTVGCAQPVITGVQSHKYDGYPILSWKAVAGAVSYELSRASRSSGTYELVGITGELTFSDKTATGGKTWYYKVTAITEKGGRSAPSAYRSAKSICAKPMVVPGVNPEGKPMLEWEAIPGAKKYEVYRTTDPTKKYTKIATTTKLRFVDSKAPAATTCHYKVRALASDSAYNSVYAEYIFAPSLCARPKLTLTVNTARQPVLKWSRVTGAVGYQVLRAVNGGEYEAVAELTGTTWKDAAFPADTAVSYKLIALAKNPVYNSYESDPKTVAVPLDKPVITAAAADEATGKPRLSWEAQEGAVSYEILRSTRSKSGYKAIGTTEELTYEDTAAAVGKTYYYRLVAVGSNTRSAQSGCKRVKCR